MSDPDAALALDRRAGLPADWLWLLDALPRARWSALPPVASHWLQMHAGFRAQQTAMDAAIEAFRRDPAEPRRLHAALIPTLAAFLQHLDGHHAIESRHYFPQFRRMEPRLVEGLDLLDRDHDAVHAHIEALIADGQAFHRAVAANAPDAVERAHRLANTLDAARAPLARHLDDEEDLVIPLMAAHAAAFR